MDFTDSMDYMLGKIEGIRLITLLARLLSHPDLSRTAFTFNDLQKSYH